MADWGLVLGTQIKTWKGRTVLLKCPAIPPTRDQGSLIIQGYSFGGCSRIESPNGLSVVRSRRETEKMSEDVREVPLTALKPSQILVE